MNQKDPNKLLFWGGEEIDEITMNQGRRNIVGASRGASVGKNLGALGSPGSSRSVKRTQAPIKTNEPSSKTKETTQPLFSYKITSFNPDVGRYSKCVYLFCYYFSSICSLY